MLDACLNKKSGKVLTVLLVIIAILLVSLTAISLFFFQKEIEKRKDVEAKLEVSSASEARLKANMEILEKEKSSLDQKNRELDEKVEDLTGEVELEQGISEQLKRELAAIKDQLQKELDKNQKLQDQLKRVADLEEENISFRSQYESAISVKSDLENKIQSLESRNQELMSQISGLEEKIKNYSQGVMTSVQNVADQMVSSAPSVVVSSDESPSSVGLDKIVVTNPEPASSARGRVLTVDTETHFVIINLGTKDGVRPNHVLGVYRDGKYLGDIRVTQVQDEMSAADLVPPLTSRGVRKDDRVASK